MAFDPVVDLDKLRRKWADSEEPGLGALARIGPINLPIDLLLEVPAQLAALRRACGRDLPAHVSTLESFLREVDAAAQALMHAQAQRDAPAGTAPVSDGANIAGDRFTQDPAVRLEEALASLEDLLEVFVCL